MIRNRLMLTAVLALGLASTAGKSGAQRGATGAARSGAAAPPSLTARIAAAQCRTMKPLLSLPVQRTISAKFNVAAAREGIQLPDFEIETTICPERATAEGARLAAKLRALAPSDTTSIRQVVQDAASYIRAARAAADTLPKVANPSEPAPGPFLGVEFVGPSPEPPPQVRDLFALSRELDHRAEHAAATQAHETAVTLYTRWAAARTSELLDDMERNAGAGIVDVENARKLLAIDRQVHMLLMEEDREMRTANRVSSRLMRGLNRKAARYACIPTQAQAREIIAVVKDATMMIAEPRSGDMLAQYRDVADAIYAYLWEDASNNPAVKQLNEVTAELFSPSAGPVVLDPNDDPCPWEGQATISVVRKSDTTIVGSRGKTESRLLDSLTYDVTFQLGKGRATIRGKFADITTLVVANTCFGRPPQPEMSVRDETRNEGEPSGSDTVGLKKVLVARAPDRARSTIGDSIHLQLYLPKAQLSTTLTKRTEITGGCPSTNESAGTPMSDERAPWMVIVGGRYNPLDTTSSSRMAGKTAISRPGMMGSVTMEWDLKRDHRTARRRQGRGG